MIDIKDISGNKLTVSISQDCERVEELMKSDHVALSWNSNVKQVLPVGSYIEYKGERFSLLEPYSPEQKDELEFLYKPLFQSKVMAWAKTPFFMYTNGAKETDWNLTDNPSNFMSRVVLSIKEETGEVWTYGIDASLPASATLSFKSIDIFSALNQISGAFNTEWWVDKTQKVIHLSKASYGGPITLEVGKNINTPSVTSSKENYFTRFYAFGSTRNITQEYKGANVNNLVNKRLTLDPEKFPLGYKDIRPDLKDGEIFSKVLIFDDIYPSSKLVISDVRCRLMWVLNNGNKIQIGTDSEGNPVYDQYSVWYFRIPGFEFNNTTYNEENNPNGMKLEGKNLSIRFESGPLSGREFELTYHDKDKTESSSDGNTFLVKEGDYEINYTKEESYIIPDMISLVPVDGNNVILFNLRMPKEYTDSAYVELENALDKEMERLSSDLNNYQFSSNPVEFYSNNPGLSIGRSVIYKNGEYSFSTRVIKLTTKLDSECEQDITIGNEQIKGNTQELKEEVISANKDLNLLQSLNNMTTALQQSYIRAQDMMMQGFAAIKDMWRFDPADPNTIYSKYNVWTEGGLSAYGKSDGQGGGGGSYGRLDSWSDYNPESGYVLSAVLGMDLKTRLDKFPVPTSSDSGKYVRINTYGDYTLSKPLWGDITSLPTTLAGYGITDAYTKTSSDGRYVLKSGDSMTGNLIIANGSNSRLSLWDHAAYLEQKSFSNGYGLYLYGAIGVLASKLYVGTTATCYEVWHQGNDDTLLKYRGILKSNTDWNSLLKPGCYFNQTGNGSGNSNHTTNYSTDLIWGGEGYVSQIQHAANGSNMYIRQRWDGVWSAWKRFAFNGEGFTGTTGVFSSTITATQGILSQIVVGEGLNEINNTTNGNIWIGYRNTSIVYLGYGNRNGTTGKYALATNDDGCVYMPNGVRIYNDSIRIGNFSGGDPTVFVSYGQSWFRIINNNAPISITANGSTTDSQIYLNTNGNVSIGDSTYNYQKLNVKGSIITTGSFIVGNSNCGLIFGNYLGGIIMDEYSTIKITGAKKLSIPTSSMDSVSTTGGYYRSGYIGSSWNSGQGALNVAIYDNSSQTPLLVAGRPGYNFIDANSSRLFSMELLNSGSTLRFSFNATHKFTFDDYGNFLATGGITCYSTSDVRLKRNITPINNAGLLLKSLGGVFEYDYSSEALRLNPNLPKHDYGLIAQNVRPMLPQYVNTIHNTEYLGIQYEKFIPLLIASQIEQMSEVEILQRRVSELESEVRQLKNKGYGQF